MKDLVLIGHHFLESFLDGEVSAFFEFGKDVFIDLGGDQLDVFFDKFSDRRNVVPVAFNGAGQAGGAIRHIVGFNGDNAVLQFEVVVRILGNIRKGNPPVFLFQACIDQEDLQPFFVKTVYDNSHSIKYIHTS